MPTATPFQMAGALKRAGFTGVNIAIGVAVGLAESSGRTDATNHNTNGSTDFGVWQINSIHRDALSMGNWADLDTNARMAKLVFDQAGGSWRPWVTFTSGSYRKYLATGMAASGNPSNTPVPGSPAPNAQNAGFPNPLAPLSVITDPHNWLRVAEFMAGFILLMIGLWQLTGIDAGKVASTAVKVGETAAVLG